MADAAPDHGPGGLPGQLRVPEDARELEPDRLAWLAEERSRRRRRRLRRLILTRRWERFGLSGPLVVICLVLTAGVGALAVVFVPHPPIPQPGPTRLSAAATVPVPATPATTTVPNLEPPSGGRLGLRLPDAGLAADVPGVQVADLRPAAVLLVPAGCGCSASVTAVYRQASEFELAVWLIAAPEPGAAASMVHLDEAATAGGARWAVDTDGVLFRALAGRGLTLALVRSDGELAALLRNVPLDPAAIPALELVLSGLRSGR